MTELLLALIPVGLIGGGWVIRAERQFGRLDNLVESLADVKAALDRIDAKVDRLITSLLERP